MQSESPGRARPAPRRRHSSRWSGQISPAPGTLVARSAQQSRPPLTPRGHYVIRHDYETITLLPGACHIPSQSHPSCGRAGEKEALRQVARFRGTSFRGYIYLILYNNDGLVLLMHTDTLQSEISSYLNSFRISSLLRSRFRLPHTKKTHFIYLSYGFIFLRRERGGGGGGGGVCI